MAHNLADRDQLYEAAVRGERSPAAAARAAIVAVLGSAPDLDGAGGAELRALAGRVDSLEVRADLVGDLDVHRLRQEFSGTLVYTLRSVEEGGQFRGDRAERHARLVAAARDYDQVDLEWATDLTTELLAAVPAGRRRLSRHAGAGAAGGAELAAVLDRMTATPAALYVLSIDADTAEDAVVVVALLAAARRSDVTAYATGAAGLFTRILAPRLGAPVVFAELGTGTGAQVGLPTLAELQTDHGFPQLAPVHGLYGIVSPSLRPSAWTRLHNRAYRALGLPAIFLPFATQNLRRFWQTVIPALDATNLPLRGMTVCTPFKECVLDLVERTTAAATQCGAGNIVWREHHEWVADATDICVVSALVAMGVELNGRRAAVVGCGAAGRNLASALTQLGAEVVLVNRSEARGRFAAQLLALPFVPLAEFSPAGFALLAHATPVTDRVVVPLAELPDDAAVLEMVPASTTTPLIAEARARGLFTVDGWQVMAIEGALQFQLMTGVAMPPSAARDLGGTLNVVDGVDPALKEES
jgi:3-dehydroquinate dehydratase/shikimate dehydrogenase